MALTKVQTNAIADDAVTTDKLANAINTERTANTAKVSLEDNAVTLAKMAGGTDGQIITYDASGDPVAVGPGTDGQVLTSTGAGSPPAFEDAAPSVGGATGVDFDDNAKIRLGTGNDTHLYHNGSHTYISHRGTGSLILEPKEGENGITLEADGAAKLYYDNTERVATSANGVALAGQIDIADGSGSDGGNHIRIGNSFDCRIYHDGTDTYINNRTGKLRILSDDLRLENTAGDETLAKFANGGASELRYNDSTKLATTNTGITVTGDIFCGTNGNGITFESSNNNGIAGSSSLLDDYEEGVWTITCANSVTLHDSNNTGSYIKVGNMVHVQGNIRIDNNGGNSDFVINNLPFTSVTGLTDEADHAIAMVGTHNWNWLGVPGNLYGLLPDNSTVLSFYQGRDNDSRQAIPARGDAYMDFSLTYRSA